MVPSRQGQRLSQYLEMSFRILRNGEYMVQFGAFFKDSPNAVPEDST